MLISELFPWDNVVGMARQWSKVLAKDQRYLKATTAKIGVSGYHQVMVFHLHE